MPRLIPQRLSLSTATDLAPLVRVEQVRPLRGILAFTDVSIDRLVNCPIAKRKVLGYYKLHREIHRTIERIDLERQWNPNRP